MVVGFSEMGVACCAEFSGSLEVERLVVFGSAVAMIASVREAARER